MKECFDNSFENNHKPKVSVIVPVYNVEKYLNECVISIINQTLKEIEIILVDDGSTDMSGQICDNYAFQDDRIQVIHHKSNEGLSSSRNDGIDASNAPFVMFVDSDDWVEREFCEAPYNAAVRSDSDVVLFKYKRHLNNGSITIFETKLEQGTLSEEEAMSFNVCVSPAAMFGLFKRELFVNIRFPTGKYHEDVGTTHRLIHTAKRINYIDLCLYNYRVGRPGSITTDLSVKDNTNLIEMLIMRVNDLSQWGYEEYALKYAFFLLITFGRIKIGKVALAEIMKGIHVPMPAFFSWRQKAMLIFYRISPVFFDVICIASRRRKKNFNREIVAF